MPAELTWVGNESLRPLLTSLDEVEPHPSNPRTHDVKAIARSLDAFGQQRPILCLPDGTIVAGHGTTKAAQQLGWTHLAVVRSNLTDDEVERYLLADNRTGDLGGYDDAKLIELLQDLADRGRLEATGYDADDLDDLIATANRVAETTLEEFGGGYAEDDADTEARANRVPHNNAYLRQIVLPVDDREFRRVASQIRVLAREYGTQGVTQTILSAIRAEFDRVWAGLPSEAREELEREADDAVDELADNTEEASE